MKPEDKSKSRKSHLVGVVTYGIIWLIWLIAGIIHFDLPQLYQKNTDIIAALASASPEAQLHFGIWLIGSITLCTFFIISIRKLSMKTIDTKIG